MARKTLLDRMTVGSKDRGVAMTEHNAYLETVAIQLAQWKVTIEQMQEHINQIQPMARRKNCEAQLESVTHQHQMAEQKLEQMSLADQQDWKTLSADMGQIFESLREMLECLDDMEHQAYDILSWSKGQAGEHPVKSIGWAEGVADEDVVTSIGWAEGQAEEDRLESVGWAEGYDQEPAA